MKTTTLKYTFAAIATLGISMSAAHANIDAKTGNLRKVSRECY